MIIGIPKDVREGPIPPISIDIFKIGNKDTIRTWGLGLMKATEDRVSLFIITGQNLTSDVTVNSRMSKLEEDIASHKRNLSELKYRMKNITNGPVIGTMIVRQSIPINPPDSSFSQGLYVVKR